MKGNNTGLSRSDAVTNALMNVRAARVMIDDGELASADAALHTAEVCLVDGGAKDIGHIPDVGVEYDNVERIIAKYQQKIERLEYERDKIGEELSNLEETVDKLVDNV